MRKGNDGASSDGSVRLLRGLNVLRTGEHFVYASGRHGSAYVDKDALYAWPNMLRILTNDLSVKTAKAHGSPHEPMPVFLGPAMGGAFIAQHIALTYADHVHSAHAPPQDPSDQKPRLVPPVHAAYAEKTNDGGFRIRKAFHYHVSTNPVVITEDVLTTGGSVKKVIEAVDALGGEVAGVAALVNRGGVTARNLGVPWLTSLVSLERESFPADACPLCMAGQPVSTDVGHGAAWLAANGML